MVLQRTFKAHVYRSAKALADVAVAVVFSFRIEGRLLYLVSLVY